MLATGVVTLAQEAPEGRLSELARTVCAAADFHELTFMTDRYIEKYLLYDPEDVSDAVMLRDATRSSAEMILLIEAANEESMAEIQACMELFLTEQLTEYRDYQPTECFKLEKARVLTKGLCLALIVSPDAEKTEQALAGAW